ncbi:MAG: response regulator [Nitrospirota bacterium]|nr:response regulator [Nitrospirota bacterium]
MNQLDSNAILFANDNPSFLMYIGILVKRLGYKVYLALDGLEAVQLAKEKKPTIIVLDYALPEINGISCITMIRKDTFLREIPIIMIGSEENDLSKQEIEKIHIQGYLKKPLNVTDFYLAIQKCLTHSIKRKHIRAPLNITVSMNCKGKQKELFALNLSIEGIFLKTAEPYPAGTEIDLVLTVDDEDPIELKGMVVSAHRISADIQPDTGMGIKFVDIPEDIRYRLYYVVMKELTRDISVGEAGETWLDEALNSD